MPIGAQRSSVALTAKEIRRISEVLPRRYDVARCYGAAFRCITEPGYRVRFLAREVSENDPESAQRRNLAEQLRLTNYRAHLVKRSMLYASFYVFFISLTILSLFAEHLIGMQRDFLALPFVALCLIALLASMYYSIHDITVSLAALELEVGD